MKEISFSFSIILFITIVFAYIYSTDEKALSSSPAAQTPETEIQEVGKIYYNFPANLYQISRRYQKIFTRLFHQETLVILKKIETVYFRFK